MASDSSKACCHRPVALIFDRGGFPVPHHNNTQQMPIEWLILDFYLFSLFFFLDPQSGCDPTDH